MSETTFHQTKVLFRAYLHWKNWFIWQKGDIQL